MAEDDERTVFGQPVPPAAAPAQATLARRCGAHRFRPAAAARRTAGPGAPVPPIAGSGPLNRPIRSQPRLLMTLGWAGRWLPSPRRSPFHPPRP